MNDGLDFTPQMLAALGKKVVGGAVVPIDAPDNNAIDTALLSRPEFPDHHGSWCIQGVWRRAPQPPEFQDAPHENKNQSNIYKYWRSLGCYVGNLSQTRKSKVALGTPDLWVFGPPSLPVFWWWETKTSWGRGHTTEQIAFAEHCARTGTLYGTGPESAAIAFSRAIGLSKSIDPRRT